MEIEQRDTGAEVIGRWFHTIYTNEIKGTVDHVNRNRAIEDALISDRIELWQLMFEDYPDMLHQLQIIEVSQMAHQSYVDYRAGGKGFGLRRTIASLAHTLGRKEVWFWVFNDCPEMYPWFQSISPFYRPHWNYKEHQAKWQQLRVTQQENLAKDAQTRHMPVSGLYGHLPKATVAKMLSYNINYSLAKTTV